MKKLKQLTIFEYDYPFKFNVDEVLIDGKILL